MAGAKTARMSKSSAICSVSFVALMFIFFLQITVIRDTSVWKVKLSHVLSLSQWNWDSDSDASGSRNEIITCDRSHKSFDICKMNSPTLFDHASLTLFTLKPNTQAQIHEKIQPYPLKSDKRAISSVKEITLNSSPPNSTCGVTHHSPALVFSAAGYTGNFFHDINENFVPLFITMDSHFPNQNVVLVITDGMTWWFNKYKELLAAFSPHHRVINAKNLTTTHCFSSAMVGLIKHGPMIIDPKLLPYPKTLLNFNAFLEYAYTQLIDPTPILYPNTRDRPRLTLVNRSGKSSRVILNQEEMIKVAEEIGFNVHVFDPSKNSVPYAYNLIHTSHAMLGVHGAGLTHFLFLRPGSVMVQVVPIGLNWASNCYSKPSKALGLEYIEYKIEANESSLSEIYGADSIVIKDPTTFSGGDWSKMGVYLKNQNVKLDMIRFRKCLTKAYKKAKIFMDKVG